MVEVVHGRPAAPAREIVLECGAGTAAGGSSEVDVDGSSDRSGGSDTSGSPDRSGGATDDDRLLLSSSATRTVQAAVGGLLNAGSAR